MQKTQTAVARATAAAAEHATTQPSIFVAMPVYSSIPAPVVHSLISLCLNRLYPTIFKTAVDSLVSRARNTLAADFLLETDCTHILWWDSDIIATPDQVARLVSHDEAIVGGLYAIKSERRLKWVLNPLDEPTIDNRGLVKVRNIGTGFLLIKREVLETMINRLPEIAFNDDYVTGHTEWDFFPVGVREDYDGVLKYESEDWGFCRLARDLGFAVYADPAVTVKHIGTTVYPLPNQCSRVYEQFHLPTTGKAAQASQSYEKRKSR